MLGPGRASCLDKSIPLVALKPEDKSSDIQSHDSRSPHPVLVFNPLLDCQPQELD